MLATRKCNIHIFYFEKKKTVTSLYTQFIILNNIKLIYNLHHALTLQIINEIILIRFSYMWVIINSIGKNICCRIKGLSLNPV